MLPVWLAIAVVLSFPGLVSAGYLAAHVLAPRLATGAGGLALYVLLLCVPLAAVMAHDPSCAAGLLADPGPWLLVGVLSGPALWWLQAALPGKQPDASVAVYPGPPGAVGFALVMVPVALIVVAEEIVWRGFLQPRLTPGPAALAFALHHLFFGWRHFGFSFLAGLVWGALFAVSGSLWPGVVSHLIYNALAWREMRRGGAGRGAAPR